MGNYNHERRWGFDQNLNKKMGNELKLKRLMTGLSQRDLAKKLGVTQKTISILELGKDNLSLTKLVRYLSALDLDAVVKVSKDEGRLEILCEQIIQPSYIPNFPVFSIDNAPKVCLIQHGAGSDFETNFFQVRNLSHPPLIEAVQDWQQNINELFSSSIRGDSELYLHG